MIQSRYRILEKNDKFFIKKEMLLLDKIKISYFLREATEWSSLIILLLSFGIYFPVFMIATNFIQQMVLSVIFLSIQIFFGYLISKYFNKINYSTYSSTKYRISDIYTNRAKKALDKKLKKEKKQRDKELSKNKYKTRGIVFENGSIEDDDLDKFLKRKKRMDIFKKVI